MGCKEGTGVGAIEGASEGTGDGGGLGSGVGRKVGYSCTGSRVTSEAVTLQLQVACVAVLSEPSSTPASSEDVIVAS